MHDSDGLALWTGANEHIWRPAQRTRGHHVSAFADNNPRGFGLMQRERDFGEYLDAVHYERRPGLWIEPLDNGAKVRCNWSNNPPTRRLYDNIAAMWVPREKVTAGSSYRLRYRLHWTAEEPFKTALARCVATRIGRGGESAKRPPGVHKFVVEFKGGALDHLAPGATVEAVLTVARGKISNVITEVVPNGVAGHWYTRFDFGVPEKETDPVDIRMFLRSGKQTLTETWLYQYHPA